MNDLQSVLYQTSLNMNYKNIDFFSFLSEKERNAYFYPQLIIEMAAWSHYDKKKARLLAEISQLIFYSIEIHEKIDSPVLPKTLVVLSGDYLYAQAFKKITGSGFETYITVFTDFIKKFSEKKILLLEGSIDVAKLHNYKYTRLAEITAGIVTDQTSEMVQAANQLSQLFLLHMTGSATYNRQKYLFLKEQKKMVSDEHYRMLEKIAASTGDRNE